MANKMFYIKDLGSKELCMVYGYVESGHYNLFYRSKSDRNNTEDIGTYPSKKAWELFNSIGESNVQN